MIFYDLLQEADIVIDKKFRITGYGGYNTATILEWEGSSFAWRDNYSRTWTKHGLFSSIQQHSIINRNSLANIKMLLTNEIIRLIPI